VQKEESISGPEGEREEDGYLIKGGEAYQTGLPRNEMKSPVGQN